MSNSKKKLYILNDNLLERYDDGIIFVVSNATDAMTLMKINENKALGVTFGIASMATDDDKLAAKAIVKVPDLVAKIKLKKGEKNINYNPTFHFILNPNDLDIIAQSVVTDLTKMGVKAKVDGLGLDNSLTGAYQENPKKVVIALKQIIFNKYNNLRNFLNYINSPHIPPISTSFNSLDRALDGGFNPGLYILGAMSSLGKSTLALQIADYVARKQPVLYFALEMSANELVAKSLSRLSYLVGTQGPNPVYPKYNSTAQRSLPVARNILKGGWPNQFTNDVQACLNIALNSYAEISTNLNLISQVQRPKASEIEKQVVDYMTETGKKPLVIIDYLQLLAPEDDRATDKQNVTWAVTILKTIALKYNLTVLVISSFNRSSYNNIYADMAAFKESGDIEYTADVIMTLSFDWTHIKDENGESLDKKIKDNSKNIAHYLQIARSENQRHLKIDILKNRFGGISDAIPFLFSARFDTFVELNDKNEPVLKADELSAILSPQSTVDSDGFIKGKTDFEIQNQIELPF